MQALPSGPGFFWGAYPSPMETPALRALRVDYAGPLRDPCVLTDGSIRVPSHITRTGVLTYSFTDGTKRRELRPAEEVFAADSLATWPGLAITVDHPPVPVTPENWASLSVGHVGDKVAPDGDHLAADVVIKSAPAIARVAAGELVEVSCGYYVEIDPTPGVTADGEAYDVIQRNIRGNHVAIGPKGWGRAGDSVRLFSGDAEGTPRDALTGFADPSPYPSGEPGTKPTEIDQEMATPLQARTDATAAPPTAPAPPSVAVVPLSEFERVTAERDLRAPRADANAAPIEVRTDTTGKCCCPGCGCKLAVADSSMDSRVALRLAAVRVDAKIDTTKSDREIMIATIEGSKLFPAFKTDAKTTDEAIRARFDLAVEQSTARADAAQRTAGAVGGFVSTVTADHTPGVEERTDGGKDLIAAAKAKRDERLRNAAKRPGTGGAK